MLEIGWAAAGLRGAATVEDTLCHGRGSRRRLPRRAAGSSAGIARAVPTTALYTGKPESDGCVARRSGTKGPSVIAAH
jgi:hypothetical protein